MEVLAALVGARVTNSVIEALDYKEVKCYYCSDSSTVLSWISREENWSVFVRNQRPEVDNGPLTENRVPYASVFQITGVDEAGPLFLRGNQKDLVLFFTCSVYRAVHLELITCLSIEAFLMGFRMFVARRGRRSTIYCDNRTNFVGAANLLHGLHWPSVGNLTCQQLHGGRLVERLIRILKVLLKRVFGQVQLFYEEMLTILCDCEALINSRLLTCVSESKQCQYLLRHSYKMSKNGVHRIYMV
ncbi:hypothetical protein AVEN_209327-1 [Araneus ventricosus]|uniref:Integrase catalytic domain-containing protein n=1 Tax=Araneus ventricosus TaxID=182803 RepID=A0A4Y2CAP7_ARAVE|nr:hypothetical protein AVEN_209327-1 [Araneus ventricosus]